MKKNNLLISPDFPPPLIGGSLVYIHNLIENSGLNFSILSDKKKRISTKKIRYLESSFIVNSSNPKRYQLFLMYLYLFLNIYKFAQYKVIVLNISAIGNGFFAYIFSKLGSKIVIMVYAEEITLALKSRGVKGYLKKLCIKGYKKASKIVSVSHFAKSILINEVGVSCEIEVLPTPLHSSRNENLIIVNKKINKNIKLLSVGRLIKRKGFIYLLKAMRLLVERKYNVKLTIIGDGVEKESIDLFIKSNNLSEFVNMHSSVNDEFLINQYKSHDIFILANLMLENGDCEGAPNVLVEAASYGLPIIAGEEGGTSDVVDHNYNGFLINPRDTNIFVKTIIELFQDKDKYSKFSQNGLIKVRRDHNKKNMGNKFYKIINSLY